jgi:hypothetical protein
MVRHCPNLGQIAMRCSSFKAVNEQVHQVMAAEMHLNQRLLNRNEAKGV